jgi:hypothetical protein
MILDSKIRDQIIHDARRFAVEHGWNLEEPIDIRTGSEAGHSVWVVQSNYLSIGRNVRIVLNQVDHSLVRAAYLPR